MGITSEQILKGTINLLKKHLPQPFVNKEPLNRSLNWCRAKKPVTHHWFHSTVILFRAASSNRAKYTERRKNSTNWLYRNSNSGRVPLTSSKKYILGISIRMYWKWIQIPDGAKIKARSNIKSGSIVTYII